MLKVKANWKVGYPEGADREIHSNGDIFKCDNEWGKKKAEQGKVEIIEEIEEKGELVVKITNLTVEEAEKVINECDNVDQIKAWSYEEKENKDRTTAINLLAGRLKELEEE